ncbi:Polypeptide N-acetylgalactosaminyltransferase 4 [Bienertia sinuspersici]
MESIDEKTIVLGLDQPGQDRQWLRIRGCQGRAGMVGLGLGQGRKGWLGHGQGMGWKGLGLGARLEGFGAGARSGADRAGENKNAAPYRNKCIENWEDIFTLFGAYRAVGDVQNNMMRQQMSWRGKWLVKEGAHLRTPLIRALASAKKIAKIKDTPRPTCQEIHTVISQVFGISRSQIMRAVKRFMNGNPDEFLMLKELPEDEKLEWVLLCLAE